MSDTKEYLKKYYQRNKEKILANHKQWRKDNQEYIKKWNKENKEYWKKWQNDNKEYYREYHKKWLENNFKHIKEYIKKYQKIWRRKNPEYMEIWAKTEKGKANNQRGNTKIRAGEIEIINTLNFDEWLNILKEYNYHCAYCGKEFGLFRRPERDHIIPISKGGNNTKDNIIPACKSCNSKKGNKIYEKGGIIFLENNKS